MRYVNGGGDSGGSIGIVGQYLVENIVQWW